MSDRVLLFIDYTLSFRVYRHPSTWVLQSLLPTIPATYSIVGLFIAIFLFVNSRILIYTYVETVKEQTKLIQGLIQKRGPNPGQIDLNGEFYALCPLLLQAVYNFH